MLFDGSHFSPLAVPTINLAEPGPRAATRLWAALLESLVCVDPLVSAAGNSHCRRSHHRLQRLVPVVL